MKKWTILVSILIISALLLFSTVANLSYPLLWNDEALGIMLTKSTLHGGYPRVYFQGNILNQFHRDLLKPLVDQETGASKENGWLAYYIGAPFVALSERIDNIYLQTGIVRLPFAIIGFASIFIFGAIARLFFSQGGQKRNSFFLVLFLSLIDIPLLLHIREARYYSVLLFIVGFYWYVLLRYVLFNTISYRLFLFLMPVVCLAIFLTYPPAVFPSLGILFIASGIFQRRIRKPTLKSLLPFMAAIVVTSPAFLFFDIFHLAELTAKIYHVTPLMVYKNIVTITSRIYADTLLMFVGLGIGVAILLVKTNRASTSLRFFLLFSFLVAIFGVGTLATLSRIPFVFTRYYIYLYPLVTISAVIAIITIRELPLPKKSLIWKKSTLFFLLCIMVFNLTIHNGGEKARRIAGYIFQLTHRYEGPLDVIIPYILAHFSTPQKLIIATNYEEFSYMYYLRSRVTVGFMGINLEEDLKTTADIIVYRPGWGTDPNIFRYFLSKDTYDEVTFPIFNYPLNNIPEFYFGYPHQFRTLYAKKEEEKVRIFVRRGSI